MTLDRVDLGAGIVAGFTTRSGGVSSGAFDSLNLAAGGRGVGVELIYEVFGADSVDAFDLDPRKRIKHLSRGQRARAGLLAALAYRPEILVLDEPSSATTGP